MKVWCYTRRFLLGIIGIVVVPLAWVWAIYLVGERVEKTYLYLKLRGILNGNDAGGHHG